MSGPGDQPPVHTSNVSRTLNMFMSYVSRFITMLLLPIGLSLPSIYKMQVVCMFLHYHWSYVWKTLPDQRPKPHDSNFSKIHVYW